MKFTTGHVVFIFIAGALGWWGYSTWSEHRAKVEVDTELKRKSDFASAALERAVARHHAITDWGQGAAIRFSIDLHRVMVNPENRPIVVDGIVRDIMRDGDRYTVSILVRQPVPVEFILEGDAELANRLSTRLPANTPCAVIARITSVEKAARNFPAASPGADEAADTFVARGRCLEWVNRAP